MSKLIRAAFYRYFHSILFYVCLALSLISAAVFSYAVGRDKEMYAGLLLLQSLIYAVLLSVTVGGEASGGCKNKIIYGYSRLQIYFSELIAACTVVSGIYLFYIIFSFLFNISTVSQTPVSLIMQSLLGFYCISLCICALCVFISFTSGKTIAAAIICVILVFGIYITWEPTETILNKAEYFTVYTPKNAMGGEPAFQGVRNPDDEDMIEVKQKNPEYVGGFARKLLVLYRDLNPYCQLKRYNAVLRPYFYTEEERRHANGLISPYLIDAGYLDTDITEDEQKFLDTAPLYPLAVTAVTVPLGALLYRKKKFR
jgi:hypothetical protein